MTLLTERHDNADAAVRQLQVRLTGDLVMASDSAYEDARRLHNISLDQRPDVIVRARDAADVVRAVTFARERGLAVGVRSGGHSMGGHGLAEGAIAIDLSALNRISIDPATAIARLGPGVTSGQLGPVAHEHGLALSTGDVATVGLGGLVTGGGIGYMVRKYGLTIDHLISAEVITADGRMVVASAEENPDLFWAVRGGGGNFGIVTGFEFRLQPAGTVLGGALVLPPTREVIRAYLDYAVDAPDALTTIGAVVHVPPAPFVPEEAHGALAFAVFLVFAGDLEEGEKAVAPLRAIARPLADTVGPMPYHGIFEYTAEAENPAHIGIRSMFTNEVPDALIDAMIEQTERANSLMHMLQVRPLGGAMARVPKDATAFAHRDKRFLVSVINEWLDPAENDRQSAWVDEAWTAVRDHADGAYVNFLADEGADRVRDAYPAETYARLAEVKRRYDPENVFRFNQNILPS